MLKPYRDSLSGIMNEVIGNAEGDFVKEKPGGSLGNLVTEAMYTAAKQIDKKCVGAICNYGGLRVPEIKKGDITKGKIFELLPFENELVILEIRGEILEQWLYLIGASGGWPISGSIYSNYNAGGKVAAIFKDSAIIEEADKNLALKITQPMIRHDSVYHIATSDYIANGGDNCEFLKGQKRTNTGLLLRDVVMNDIRKRTNIQPDTQPRMIFIK